MLGLFGDVATELLIRLDGDEGLFVAYDLVEFTAPVYAGDYSKLAAGSPASAGTSRTMEFTAHKVIAARPDPRLGRRGARRAVLVVRRAGPASRRKPRSGPHADPEPPGNPYAKYDDEGRKPRPRAVAAEPVGLSKRSV